MKSKVFFSNVALGGILALQLGANLAHAERKEQPCWAIYEDGTYYQTNNLELCVCKDVRNNVCFDPTPTPVATGTATVVGTPTVRPTPTEVCVLETGNCTGTPVPTPTIGGTRTAEATKTAVCFEDDQNCNITPRPTATPQATFTATAEATPTSESTPTVVATSTASSTPTVSGTVTVSGTPTVSGTATSQPTATATAIATSTIGGNNNGGDDFGGGNDTSTIFVPTGCSAIDVYPQLYALSTSTKAYFGRLAAIRVGQLQKLRVKNERSKAKKAELLKSFANANQVYQSLVASSLAQLAPIPPVMVQCPSPAPSRCRLVQHSSLIDFRLAVKRSEGQMQKDYKSASSSASIRRALNDFFRKNFTTKETPAIAKKAREGVLKYSEQIPAQSYICTQ